MSEQIDITEAEAELLLYLSDELDPQRKAGFEARLASEPALRQMLEEFQSIDTKLAGVRDGSAAAFVSERAMKSSLRLVREQTILRNQAVVATRAPFRIPAYAIAAAIVVVFTLGLVTLVMNSSPQTQQPQLGSKLTDPSIPVRNDGPGNPTGPGIGFGLAAFGPIGVEQYADSTSKIDAEIDALSLLSDFEESETN